MKKKLGIALAVLLLAGAAGAQQKGDLTITSLSEIEIAHTRADGTKEVKRVDATTRNVAPGQTVIFTNRYAYAGAKPATDVVIKNPVPEHMLYTDGSAEGADTRIEFSVDGGKTYGPAAKLKVRSADGKERRAGAADYTHIRWIIEKPLKQGAQGSVSFRATVK